MNSVEDLILYVKSDKRVCPNPSEWDQISQIIGAAKPGHKCVPLILAGWAFTSDQQKRDRLIEQIHHAIYLGEDIFQTFAQAIYDLEKEDWYYADEPLSTWQWDGR